MNIKILCQIFCGLVSLGAWGAKYERKDIAQPFAKKPTTVLVYMVVDSRSMASFDFDLQEMQRIGSNEKVNVLVYATFGNALDNWSRAFIVQKGRSFQDGEVVRYARGQAEPTIDACAWAHEKFPSDNFILIFCDHATGSFFTEHNVNRALSHLVKLRNNKLVDVVAFNAPMMATLEVAHAIQPYAHFLVAAEGVIPGKRYPYKAALMYASQWKFRFSPYKLVLDMIDEYEYLYDKKAKNYTFSVMDLSAEPKLFHALDVIAAGFSALLGSQEELAIRHILEESCSADECTCFGANNRIDLGHFLNNAQANVAQAKIPNKKEVLGQIARDIIAAKCALSGCVVENVQGALFPGATGITIDIERDLFFDVLMRSFWEIVPNH